MRLTVLDCFAGIGGFSLGLERTGGFETVSFIEIDPFCRQVLAKHWPEVPQHDDITTYDFREGEADVVTGGFPCQDISVAGRGAGLAGERSGLWSELCRAVRVVRPRYGIFENVAALLSRGLGDVLRDLAAIGYDAEWYSFPTARAMGHERERVFIVAYPGGSRSSQWSNSGSKRCHGSRFFSRERFAGLSEATVPAEKWSDRPLLGRCVSRIPRRVDRLRSLGNAVVPQIPELIGRAILDAEAAPPQADVSPPKRRRSEGG